MSHIVLFGNPIDGLSIVGPFDTVDIADAYADRAHLGEYWVTSAEPPDRDIMERIEPTAGEPDVHPLQFVVVVTNNSGGVGVMGNVAGGTFATADEARRASERAKTLLPVLDFAVIGLDQEPQS